MDQNKPQGPTVELFLKNIQAEQGRSSGPRPHGPGNWWQSDWSFPWSQDWWDNWWNPYACGRPTGPASINNLLSRKEPDGAVIYNSQTKAIYKTNDAGLTILLELQAGKTVEEVAQASGLSTDTINTFIGQLLQ
jgi:hypothetical protein